MRNILKLEGFIETFFVKKGAMCVGKLLHPKEKQLLKNQIKENQPQARPLKNPFSLKFYLDKDSFLKY